MKRLLHITQRMLVIALCLCAAGQVNAITIKVQKGGTAPYLYAYLGSGDGATKLTGDWPGTQFTEKDDNGYWTMDIPNQSTINLILNMGDGQPQTGDITGIVGVNGVATFIYDGNNKAVAPIPQAPQATYQTGKVAYFACPPSWDTSNLKSQIKHNTYYEEHTMTYIGTDGAGSKVYADLSFTGWNDTPQQIHFYDMSGNDTPMFDYVLGGYYHTGGLGTQLYTLSSSNGYSDENFRAGIATQLNINDGAVFAPSTITYLDVSNKNISSLAGIENFPNLIELYAQQNDITAFINLSQNSNLERLNLASNNHIRGFNNSSQTDNDGCFIRMPSNSPLKYLNMSDCPVMGYFQTLTNSSGFNAQSIDTLIMNNCPRLGWSSAVTNLKNSLVYLEWSNNAITSSNSVIDLTTMTKLAHLNLSKNTHVTNVKLPTNSIEHVNISNCNISNDQTFVNCNILKYIDISNNSGTAKNFKLSNNPNLKVFKATNAAIKENGLTWEEPSPNLDTLIVSGNNAMQYLNSLNYATNLKYLDMSGGDLYLQNMPTFVGSNFPSLEYLDFSNDKITEAKTLQGFSALKTLKIGGNFLTSNSHGIDKITLSNCPAIESIDVSGSKNMAEIGLVNQGYTNDNFTLPTITYADCNLLSMLDMSDNTFTSVPELTGIPSTIVSLKLNNNALNNITMPSGSPIQFLYAENNSGFNGGDYELTAEAAGSLKGLDLGNNGFTSFKAVGTALSALMIGNNTGLTTLELHGNNNLTCTTASTTMTEGSGLYLLGNTNLESINIENSKFNNIGANKSLEGLTKVKTLRAAHNEFETFTNSNYDNADSRSKDLATIVGKPSLEHLTGLENLDLSYNLLKDSVHLYRNTQLKRLDVSHNQILGPLPTTPDERTAMINKKLTTCLKYGVTIKGDSTGNHKIGPVGKSVTLTDDLRNELTQYDTYRQEYRYADFRPCDLRDTTGLYHLDLYYNTQLEYLDISYTNIHNTAAERKYMNPGWESSPDGWDGWVSNYTPNAQYGPVKHHFILINRAKGLRVFKADHNNMQSLGTANNLQLDTLSATHMYGDCAFMADVSIHGYGGYIGYGSKGFTSPNCAKAKYVDLSYGGYYSITPTNLANVEKLILTGNPLGGGHYPGYVLDVTHNSKLQQLQADQCTDLQTIESHGLNDLTILDVTGNTALKTLRAYDDPVLYNAQTDFITGLFGCSNLEELWVSNDNLPVLDVAYNTKLKTLKCYDNARLPELNLDKNTALSYLDFHNCKLNEIDLSENTALTYIDCSSPRVAQHLEEDGINKLSDLDIPADAPIQTVIANCNNLYRMTGLNKQSLTRLEFEHNHINGIDLSKTGLNNSTLKDADNGRTIAADYTIVTVKDANNNATHYDLYYFQLDSLKTSQNEVFLGGKHSVDILKQDVLDNQGYRDDLNYEGLVSTKITAWTAHATGPIVGHRPNTYANAYIDPHNVNSLIDTDKISGTIVVLDEHNKRAEYTYDTGVSGHTSTYYLDWTAPATPTAVTDIETDAKPTVTGGNGIISVTAPDGTAVMVYDMAGRLVQQATATGGEVVIDGMSPGVYIVNGEKVIVK